MASRFSILILKIRIVHGWDCDNIEPLDILSIKILDPHLSISL